ncbi:unnamed protein product [Ilex paraguariensis]|uniref:Leucine-rich repeat-containing N-terminal plant-type domain-containing protein n=1 Tax=Ilex paraguariensis TaxID=185542 RepID=A0ABC8URA3_9AQUA
MVTPTSVLVLLFAVLSMQGLGFSSCSTSYSNGSCIESERKALVKFRESLADQSNRLLSWIGEDCCKWNGVVCSEKTGHVIRLNLRNPTPLVMGGYENYRRSCLGGELSPSLLDLKHLRYLDLSRNYFSGTPIPEFLGSLENLRYLNLSNSEFGGKIPHRLGNLSSLNSLDFRGSFGLMADSLWWVSKLSSLKQLDMTGVNLGNATDWLQAINKLSSLVVLNLAFCYVLTIPPLSHVNFTTLASLDLSWNQIHSTMPLFLNNISGPVHLDLQGNHFYGPVPDTLGRLTSLTYIDLSINSFNASIPDSLGNLRSLVHLDLSLNEFQGNIPITLNNLCSLHVLDLSFNRFSGEIPSFAGTPIGCLKNLELLLLTWNSFHGSIPESFGTLSHLRELDVGGSHLNETVPLSIGQLSKLERLDISNNSFVGIVSEFHFSKLINLKELCISSNSFILNVSSEWIPPFQLRIIKAMSFNLGPQFPQWLQTQAHVERMIISNASISGTIPDWFEKVYSRIFVLDLSHNNLSGKLPKFVEYNPSDGDGISRRGIILKSNRFDGQLTPIPSDVYFIDISNNLLSGHIPPIQDAGSLTLEYLVLSNNYLSGEIPTFLCQVKSLQAIDLSKNQFSGRLPWCLGDLQQLKILDLTDNNLEGEIPSSLGSLRWLTSLHLHNNKFCGRLPLSLHNLTRLRIFDLSGNAFNDIIPPWIGENLNNLKFLSLQSNKFHGDIPLQLCWLSALQLLNVAHNSITGNIPLCFGNFTAMVVDHIADANGVSLDFSSGNYTGGYYQYNVIDSMKGTELQFTTTVPLIASIDLSNNDIDGEIPEELMDLFGLQSLNLAGNHLKGRIPEKIGNLKQLESLDLSRNEFSGSIPPSLSDLNFLSRLNLSFNNLSGRIPAGHQLQTLDDQSIYTGNSNLCGAPLSKGCLNGNPVDIHKPVDTEGGEGSVILWFYAGIGPGFLVGFLVVCGALYFKKSWRYAYLRLIENVCNRLLLASALTAARLRRKFHNVELRG